MKTPKWAETLLLNALVYLEEHGHNVTTPILKCYRGWRYESSGRTFGKERIHLTIGKDRTDAKLVLLHEVAHTVTESEPQYWNIERAKKQGWIFPKEPERPIIIRNISHTSKFWDIAWELYRWAKLPIRYCQQREYHYKVGAQVAYKRNRRKEAK